MKHTDVIVIAKLEKTNWIGIILNEGKDEKCIRYLLKINEKLKLKFEIEV